MALCNHHIESASNGGVLICSCTAVRYAVCSYCSRIVKPDDFSDYFSAPDVYDLQCSICRDVFCVDCSNIMLGASAKICFKCRSTDNKSYEDEAAIGWIVTYHCSYLDRNGRSQDTVYQYPSMFASRKDALDTFTSYLPIVLASLVETELIERTVEELEKMIRLPVVTDMLDKVPGFHVRSKMNTPAGPALHVVVVAKTIRNKDDVF